MQQHLVLIIQYLLWTTTIVSKSQLVGINRHGGIKRFSAEPDILVARAAEYHHKEVHLQMPAVCTLHPVFTEVCLGVFAERKLRKLLVRTGRLLKFGNRVLGTDVYHIVENGLAADSIYGIAVHLLQMILYLLARITRAAAKLIQHKTLIRIHLMRITATVGLAGEKFFLRHTSILTHAMPVYA